MKIPNLNEIILTSITLGLLCYISTLTTVLFWQNDGFTLMEGSFASIIGGVYFFFLMIIISLWRSNAYVRSCLEEDKTPINKWFHYVLVLVMSITVIFLFDYLYFQIDPSISEQFAQSLKQMMENSKESVEGIDDFAEMPFMVQNGVVTFIGGLFGGLFGLIGVKKNGQLFKMDHPSQQ